MNTTATTIRASVQEAAFFQNIKYLFAGSYTFLGELLQNARRANATRIEITYGAEDKVLTIKDNGCGIKDFADLLCFSKSGWNNEVTQQDRPFGMGVFSLFHVAAGVVFCSRGMRLEVGLNDVVEARELQLERDEDGPATGTQIELRGLVDALADEAKLLSHLRRFAMGFPVEILFNGQNIPRPLDANKLDVVETFIGTVALGQDSDLLMCFTGSVFLQGLPLGTGHGNFPVIHLDSAQFQAVMPDRTKLYDHEEAMRRINKVVQQTAREFIRHQREQLSDEEFIRRYWSAAMHLGGLDDLLNAVPLVPGRLFETVLEITARGGNTYGVNHNGQLFTREQFESGTVKAWIDGPSKANDSVLAPLFLTLAKRCDIRNVPSREIPSDHWLHQILPRASELRASWRVDQPGMQVQVYTTYDSITAVACKGVEAQLDSLSGPVFQLECRLDNCPVVLPNEGAAESEDDLWYTDLEGAPISVYVPTNAKETPEMYFCEYLDAWENENAEDIQSDSRSWDDAYAMLQGGSSLLDAVETSLMRGEVQFSLSDELVLIRATTQWNSYSANWGDAKLQAHALDDALLERIALRLPGVTPQALQQAFAQELQPGHKQLSRPSAMIRHAANAWLVSENGFWHLVNGKGFKESLGLRDETYQPMEVREEAGAKVIKKVTAAQLSMPLEAFERLDIIDQARHVRTTWSA